MPAVVHSPSVFALALLAATAGCAEQLHLLERGGAGAAPPPFSFWPPPPASAVLSAAPASLAGVPVVKAAEHVAQALEAAGYTGARWYPIGAGCAHGFAVTTRLERIEDEDRAAPSGRWATSYPDAAELRWLEEARTPTLPSAGRYRIFLIAYTDLPVGPSARAPRWKEETVMAGPSAPPLDLRAAPLVSRGYRLDAFVYEYRASGGPEGEIVMGGAEPAAAQVAGAGLDGLFEGAFRP